MGGHAEIARERIAQPRAHHEDALELGVGFALPAQHALHARVAGLEADVPGAYAQREVAVVIRVTGLVGDVGHAVPGADLQDAITLLLAGAQTPPRDPCERAEAALIEVITLLPARHRPGNICGAECLVRQIAHSDVERTREDSGLVERSEEVARGTGPADGIEGWLVENAGEFHEFKVG